MFLENSPDKSAISSLYQSKFPFLSQKARRPVKFGLHSPQMWATRRPWRPGPPGVSVRGPGRSVLALKIAFVLACTTIASFVTAAQKRHPEATGTRGLLRSNFVVIFADDLGYGDLGCYGATKIKTPHLDQLAAEGVRFTNFYAQPVCGPSRAALMTGCYPIRCAEPGNRKNQHTILHPNEVTLAELLKQVGYATACIGKWHLGKRSRNSKSGWDPRTMPNGQGFDYFLGTPLPNGVTVHVKESKFRTSLMRNGEVLIAAIENWDGITSRYTEEAVQFIRKNRNRPFFLYLAHNMPHIPLGASPAFKGRSEYGPYGDAVEEIDWSTGRIVETLRELELAGRTLVLFTSDNGPWIETTRANLPHAPAFIPPGHSGTTGGLRGYKMLTWEGGLRVPCIAWWRGHIPGGRICDQVAATIDILPTFARLAGVPLPSDRVLDGRDIWPLLSGQPNAVGPHDKTGFFYYRYTALEAVRSGRWKLVLPRPAHPPWTGWSGRFYDPVQQLQLYDLKTDPSESRNVALEHPEVMRRLLVLLDRGREDLGDYDRIGRGARFFDPGPRRPALRRRTVRVAEAHSDCPLPVDFDFAPALGPERNVSRRDPSDVIKVGGLYHVWYTKVKNRAGVFRYPSGYSGEIWYATSRDGRSWREQGRALSAGGPGQWDSHGVFTPNILVAKGRYYLFYTGVGSPFDEKSPTAIGVAVATRPEGPWRKLPQNPVLRPSSRPDDFDSMRVDDACLIVRAGRYWLYYKGRQKDRSPGRTRMGVAIADQPEGPYHKHPAGPLHRGHEVLVWPHGTGVASLATAAGPLAVYFAADGIHFEKKAPLRRVPHAPGGFRSDNFRSGGTGPGLLWGISHARVGRDLYLVRFDCRLFRTTTSSR